MSPEEAIAYFQEAENPYISRGLRGGNIQRYKRIVL
jgi:hypothetical protein